MTTASVSRIGCWAFGAALASIPAATHAQVNPFRGYTGPTLSKQDIAAGTEAAGRLLGADANAVGATQAWTGEASGNSGVLTVERAYRKRGHECRAVRSDVTYKAGTGRSLLLQACNVGGRWQLAD